MALKSDGESMWSGFAFKSLIARRYLLVAHPKVTTRAKWAIGIALIVRVVLGGAIALSASGQDWHSPLWDLERASEVLFAYLVVDGVLRYSKPAVVAFFGGLVITGLGFTASVLIEHHVVIPVDPGNVPSWLRYTILGAVIGGGVISGLAVFFGALRAFFTFFTTVPIGGVWIGTGALVCVLSVMSGFESDLREKILGSNAHIQVTREEGDFTDWHNVKKQIDAIPGVVASTPYAVSEVVIAANNNGQNVIIKGIDPATVGGVTELVRDLEDHDAMKRLPPLIDDTHDLRVPQAPPAKGHVIDPPPADMPSGGTPIDYSKGSGSDDASAEAGSADATHGYLVDEAPLIDPPPHDLVTSDEPPADYSGSAPTEPEPAIRATDFADTPPSRRTQALPGILVGRELVKQTHLYTGEEVRVVSPLSDPANPDATGTPIPFNRDYRVAGVFFTGMYEYDLKYVYVTLESLDEFLDRGDAIDGIEVRVPSPDDSDRYVDRISAVLGPQYRVQDWKELNRSLFSALKLEKYAMFLVLGIVILVASFSIVGNLIMVVVEKQREIAVLKTLGASDVGIMQIFAIQGLMIGIVGTVLGVASGLAACLIGKSVGIPLNPDVYYIDRMPVHVEYNSVMLTGAAGVLISIAATFYPALLAARVRPAIGMRH